MRRAPESINPFKYAPEPGDTFAGGIIGIITIWPDKRTPELTIELTDGSFLTYEEGRLGTWTLRDATLQGSPMILTLDGTDIPPDAG